MSLRPNPARSPPPEVRGAAEGTAGAASRTVPPHAPPSATTAIPPMAASFTGASPLAVSLVKRALAASPAASLETMLDFEADAQALCFGSAGHREAVAAFLNKQPGRFTWPTGEVR